MSKAFEFVDVTPADVAFKAWGKTLDELFANAAKAMFEVMVNTEQVEQLVERELEVKGDDLPDLLFNWLNELLYYVDAENLVFSYFEVNIDEPKLKLKAKCKGEPMNPEKHELRTHVKAATYHKLKVEKKNGLWEAFVLLDI